MTFTHYGGGHIIVIEKVNSAFINYVYFYFYFEHYKLDKFYGVVRKLCPLLSQIFRKNIPCVCHKFFKPPPPLRRNVIYGRIGNYNWFGDFIISSCVFES